MKLQKQLLVCLLAVFGNCFMNSCQDDHEEVLIPEQPSEEDPSSGIPEEIRSGTRFAADLLNIYYVWNKEIEKDLPQLNPDTCTNPFQVVYDLRYSDPATGVKDKWTFLTNDLNSLQESVEGIETTYGMMYKVGKTPQGAANYLVAAVVYDDSPAAKAGLQRGDIIALINGKAVSDESMKEMSQQSSVSLTTGRLKDGQLVPDGQTHQLTAVKMYTSPVLHHQIYEVNGKKVGYLCYSSFDLESAGKLIDICKEFKAAGIEDLILDLRYNGGGYVVTEIVLASMLAPEAVAHNPKAVFEREQYNSVLMDAFAKEGYSTETYFRTSWNYTQEKNGIDFVHDTSDANIGLQKIYGLITANSASASEALLGGLMPYMEVETIGTNSHGKYCTGQLLSPADIYSKYNTAIKDWGMYVMLSIYQNSKGETPCMPNGIVPDKEVYEGIDLVPWGDERDPLLRAALESAGKVYEVSASDRSASQRGVLVRDIPHNAVFGKRIALPVLMNTKVY